MTQRARKIAAYSSTGRQAMIGGLMTNTTRGRARMSSQRVAMLWVRYLNSTVA